MRDSDYEDSTKANFLAFMVSVAFHNAMALEINYALLQIGNKSYATINTFTH